MLKPFADARSIYDVIEPALWAPSIHNSQPWSFRITADDRIELRANVSDGAGARRGRWDLLLHSPAPGPWAREYAISCGAALMNLRLAIRVLGHDPVIALVPVPDSDPGLLASVEIVTGRTHEPKALEEELYAAIRQRHTDRRPFSDAPVRPGILVEMERAAAREHGWLRVLHGPYARRWLKASAAADAAIAVAGRGTAPAAGNSWGLAGGDGRDSAADAMLIAAADEAAASGRLSYDALLHRFRDELIQWTAHTEDGFGVPLTASGPRPARANSPVRDFSLGAADSGAGSGPADAGIGPGADSWSARARRHAQRERFERHPQLMMLFTDRDDPADWLRAGQALQRALLTATSLGVSASFLTQPLELADLAFRYDPQYGRLHHGPLHHGPLPHHDNCQQDSRNAVDRRGYVRSRILGSTPWLEVPQMAIRVGYPKVSAGQPDIRAPRQEPEVIDVRCVPSQRVVRPPEPDPPEPQPPEAGQSARAH
jgi:nitroreductase